MRKSKKHSNVLLTLFPGRRSHRTVSAAYSRQKALAVCMLKIRRKRQHVEKRIIKGKLKSSARLFRYSCRAAAAAVTADHFDFRRRRRTPAHSQQRRTQIHLTTGRAAFAKDTDRRAEQNTYTHTRREDARRAGCARSSEWTSLWCRASWTRATGSPITSARCATCARGPSARFAESTTAAWCVRFWDTEREE